MAYDHKEQESSENRISEVELNDALADLKQSLLINDNPRSEEIQEDEQSQESETIIDQIKEAVVDFLEFVGLIGKEEEKSLLGDSERSDDIDEEHDIDENDISNKAEEFVNAFRDFAENKRSGDSEELLDEDEKSQDTLLDKMLEALVNLLEALGILDEKEKESFLGQAQENKQGEGFVEALEAIGDKLSVLVEPFLDKIQEIHQDEVQSPFAEEQIEESQNAITQPDDLDIDAVSSPLHKEPEVLISKSSVQDAALEGEDDIVQDQYYAKEMVLEELKAALSNNKPDSGSQDQDTNSLPTKENEGHSR